MYDEFGTNPQRIYLCPKCGGSGDIPHFAHVENGRCFLCDGFSYVSFSAYTGYMQSSAQQFTPEATTISHRWLNHIVVCLIDDEKEAFFITDKKLTYPRGATPLSLETPLAQALINLEIGASTKYRGPTGQTFSLQLMDAKLLKQ